MADPLTPEQQIAELWKAAIKVWLSAAERMTEAADHPSITQTSLAEQRQAAFYAGWEAARALYPQDGAGKP